MCFEFSLPFQINGMTGQPLDMLSVTVELGVEVPGGQELLDSSEDCWDFVVRFAGKGFIRQSQFFVSRDNSIPVSLFISSTGGCGVM